jgi:hypothetical protein
VIEQAFATEVGLDALDDEIAGKLFAEAVIRRGWALLSPFPKW